VIQASPCLLIRPLPGRKVFHAKAQSLRKGAKENRFPLRLRKRFAPLREIFFRARRCKDVSETLGERGESMLRELLRKLVVGRLGNGDTKCHRVGAENYHFSLLCG